MKYFLVLVFSSNCIFGLPITTIDPFAQEVFDDKVKLHDVTKVQSAANSVETATVQDEYNYYGIRAKPDGAVPGATIQASSVSNFTDSSIVENSTTSAPLSTKSVFSTLSTTVTPSSSFPSRQPVTVRPSRKVTKTSGTKPGRQRGPKALDQVIPTEDVSTIPSESLKRSTADLMKFLTRFGYLQEGGNNTEALFREEAVDDAVRRMQAFAGITPTGKVDSDTLELLISPRCGNKDLNADEAVEQAGQRAKRYILGPSGWNKRRITYFIANWTPKLTSEEKVRTIVADAFKVWADYARLVFEEVFTTNADIVILFGTGYHGDNYPFDGPGYTLAHAYYPYEFGHLGGDVHFDEAEPWAINPEDTSGGIDFFTVAVHEIGHSLGLSHSPVTSSIMYPYYKGVQKNFQLDYDDVLAMYQLYISRSIPGDIPEVATTAAKTTTTTTTTARPSTTTTTRTTTLRPTTRINKVTTPYTEEEDYLEEDHTINYDGDYDTIDSHRNKSAATTVPTTSTTVRTTTTTKIVIPDICKGSFDAVSMLRGELFFFKEGYVWRLRQRNMVEPSYPVPFHQMFFSLPSDVKSVDAVYERKKDSALIFFSGPHYWVSDGNSVTHERRPLTELGLPDGVRKIDAALLWPKNGKLYLFSKNLYWRYDDNVHRMDEGYPKEMSRWRGVPPDIDAAFSYTDGKTYFFKKDLHWRFNDTIVKIDSKSPENAPKYWLPC